MISRIQGTVIHQDPRYVIVDVGGVGYKIFTNNPSGSSGSPAELGNEVAYWTYLAVRDDALNLYGFSSRDELTFFELLIGGVSGIGPKTALNILNTATLHTLVHAISQEDASLLVKISGIGRKVAEKIVLELKGKLPDNLQALETNAGGAAIGAHHDHDAIEALKALGYGFDEARAALKSVENNLTSTGARVKAALKVLN